MPRRTLFVKLSVALVVLTLLLSWIQTRAALPPLAGFTALVVLATLAAALLARYLARPLDQMRRAALAQAAGEDSVAWPHPTTREMRALSNAVQTMALNLQEKIRVNEGLLAEQRAIFESMAEGVLVVDPGEKLVDVNRAALQMLGVRSGEARGRDMLEVIRNARLADLMRRTLAGREAVVEGDVTLLAGRERHLQVHGSVLRAGPRIKGALLVLTDVTRLRQLETLQREFVANASHELKTPVTSIKGFAETLAGEEVDAEHARRFTRIIARQAEQLGTLVDDLLELTRLEYDGERTPLERRAVEVAPLLDGAMEQCAAEANQKDIRIRAACPPGLRADLHPVLFQRAVANLVDNAVKYSPGHSAVELAAEAVGTDLLVRVSDQGPGIAPEHQERIFERFYRVDKSRSRKLGGTGLGLSIVRHVAHAHGGAVTVESEPGRGSTFRLRVPSCAR